MGLLKVLKDISKFIFGISKYFTKIMPEVISFTQNNRVGRLLGPGVPGS